MMALARTSWAQEVPSIACIVNDINNVKAGSVRVMRDIGGEVLIGAEEGLFRARGVNGVVTVDPAGNADTGGVSYLHDLRGGRVLIGAEKGLFLARVVDDVVAVDRVGKADTGRVSEMQNAPGGGVLIGADGLFLARVVNDRVTVGPAGTADTGSVLYMHDLPGGEVLIRATATEGWFLAHVVKGAMIVDPAADMRDIQSVGSCSTSP